MSDAVAHCTEALRLVPSHPNALRRRAAALEALERYATAAVDYDSLAALGGDGAVSAVRAARAARAAAAALGG
jgi:diacylglycerol kinase family enzyme